MKFLLKFYFRQVRRRLEGAHHQLEWLNGDNDTASVTSAPTSSRSQPGSQSVRESSDIKEPEHLRKHRYLTRRIEHILSERQAISKSAEASAPTAIAGTQTSARSEPEPPSTDHSESVAASPPVPKLENLEEAPQIDENETKENTPISVPEVAADAKGKTFVVAPRAARRAQPKKPATRSRSRGPHRVSVSTSSDGTPRVSQLGGGSVTPRVSQLRSRSRPAQAKANANGANNVSCLFSAEASTGTQTQTQPNESYFAPLPKFVMYGQADEEPVTFTLKRTYNVKSTRDVHESALRAKQVRECENTRKRARTCYLRQCFSLDVLFYAHSHSIINIFLPSHNCTSSGNLTIVLYSCEVYSRIHDFFTLYSLIA